MTKGTFGWIVHLVKKQLILSHQSKEWNQKEILIKNLGFKLDYGTIEEIEQSHAQIMVYLGKINVTLALLFIGISVIKFIIWIIKKAKL